MSKLSSGIVSLIRRCPSPVLVVPGGPSPFQHALLAYDGTPKAREALFVATYIAGRWGVALTAVSIPEGDRVTSDTLDEARDYLEAHGVSAEYQVGGRQDKGAIADAILNAATDASCDLILMGGYGVGPMVEAVLGSTVDRVLRSSARAMFICR
jgi:nucleotide-binding universal stress UspA family protein